MQSKQLTNKSFSSKLLLFGEYTILNGGAAFAIPFQEFFGVFEAIKGTDQRLIPFFEYLIDNFSTELNLPKLNKWQLSGIRFNSNIKEGYGIGSSGALTAATFHEFFLKEPRSTSEIQKILARIEGFFHGKSSGADALSIYLNNGILINKNKDIKLLEKSVKDLPGYFYIIDTQIKRSTKHLVDHFMDKINIQKNRTQLEHLERCNQSSIDASINGKTTVLHDNFQEISKIQFELFNHMIPKTQIKIWEEGLISGNFHIKLLGAGGGGFLLAYSVEHIEFESDLIQLINH